VEIGGVEPVEGVKFSQGENRDNMSQKGVRTEQGVAFQAVQWGNCASSLEGLAREPGVVTEHRIDGKSSWNKKGGTIIIT